MDPALSLKSFVVRSFRPPKGAMPKPERLGVVMKERFLNKELMIFVGFNDYSVWVVRIGSHDMPHVSAMRQKLHSDFHFHECALLTC